MRNKKARRIRKAIEKVTGYPSYKEAQQKELETRKIRKEIFVDDEGRFVAEVNEDNEEEFKELYTKKEIELLKARSAIRGFKNLCKYGFKLKKQLKD